MLSATAPRAYGVPGLWPQAWTLHSTHLPTITSLPIEQTSLGGWISALRSGPLPPWTFLKSSLRRLKTVQRGAKTRQDVPRYAKMRPRGP